MKTKLLGLIACMALIGPAEASEITYNMNINDDGVVVIGTITTDGTIGALSDADIISYALTTQWTGPSPPATAQTSVACSSSCSTNVNITSSLPGATPELIASATQITFDFPGNQYDYLTIGNISSGNYIFLGDAQGYGGEFATEGVVGIYIAAYPYINFDTDDLIATAAVATTPLPGALPLFATGIGAMGMLGWRRKRKNAAAIAA
jgi:hypothetical protein